MGHLPGQSWGVPISDVLPPFPPAVCVLFSCLPLAGAVDFGVAVVPPHPTVGQTVTLLVGGARGVAQSCTWYRRSSTSETDRILTFTSPDMQSQGPASTGRETLGGDCSLRIVGLTPQDNGTGRIPLLMYSPPSPPPPVCVLFSSLLPAGASVTLMPVPPQPRVGQAVTLAVQGMQGPAQLCAWYRGLTTAQSQQILIFVPPWELHRGPVFTGRETPANDCSLRITGVTPQDSGDYTLVFQAGGDHPLAPPGG
uniref:Immunoglobulin V-set domain-containing protein n=1 Tax=Chrysemys picta bellii TaxID=8478 RepID=A0A8C3HNJ5_CHRPI